MKYYMVQVAVDGFGADTWCAFAALTRAECEKYIEERGWELREEFTWDTETKIANILELEMGEPIPQYWD